jgi:DNA-directed RNA polymerase subunit F
MSEAEFEGFLRGNAIKYLSRAGRKGDSLQDLKKALHYLEKLVSVKGQRE